MCWTELTLIPTSFAIMATVQWVTSKGGSIRVISTTRVVTSDQSGGMRERRVLSRKRPSTPSSAKRSCQRQTQVFDLAVRRMISTVPMPAALSRMMSARQTCFWAVLRSRISASRRRRSDGETSIEIPVRMPQSRMPIHRQESLNGLNCQVLSTSTEA